MKRADGQGRICDVIATAFFGTGVRVDRALSSESDLVTHSASPRARLSHVMISPPTRPIDFACNARLASPLPLASCLHRSPFPSSLSFAIQTPRHKPCRCHAIRPPSPPDDARVPLDTGQVALDPSPVECSCSGHSFLGLGAVYGIIGFVSVCFHLSCFSVWTRRSFP